MDIVRCWKLRTVEFGESERGYREEEEGIASKEMLEKEERVIWGIGRDMEEKEGRDRKVKEECRKVI